MAFDSAHVSRLLAEARRLSNQRERLFAEAQLLSSRYERLEDEAQKYVEDYAQSSCFDLCSEMQARSPRELRDLVYESLLGETRTIDTHMMNKHPGILSSHRHLRNVGYVGKKTLAELAETWYHHCEFDVDYHSDVANLFNSCDIVWGLPDLDLIRHVRHVKVSILPEDGSGSSWCISETGLPKNFDQLTKLKNPATVTVNLETRWGIWERTAIGTEEPGLRFGQSSKDFFPVLKSLISAGVNVAVVLEHDETEGTEVRIEHLDTESWTTLITQILLRTPVDEGEFVAQWT